MNKERFSSIWKDPVWSKVIAALLLGIGSLVYSLVTSILDRDYFFRKLYDLWTVEIPLWQVAILIILILSGQAVIYAVQHRNEIKKNTHRVVTNRPQSTAIARFVEPRKEGTLVKGKIPYEILFSQLPSHKYKVWLCVEVLGELWYKVPLEVTDNKSKGEIAEGAQEFLLSVIELTEEGQTYATSWLGRGKENRSFEGQSEVDGARVTDVLLKRK